MADDTLPPVGATVELPLRFGGRWTRDADGWLSDGGLDLPDFDIWVAALDHAARSEQARKALEAELAAFRALAVEATKVAHNDETPRADGFRQTIAWRLAALAPKEASDAK